MLFLFFFRLVYSSFHLSLVFPFPVSLSPALYQIFRDMTSGHSEVKWCKVIVRSSHPIGWPLQGLLLPANRLGSRPPPPFDRAGCNLQRGGCGCHVTRAGRQQQMIDEAFSTCLEWSCPHLSHLRAIPGPLSAQQLAAIIAFCLLTCLSSEKTRVVGG